VHTFAIAVSSNRACASFVAHAMGAVTISFFVLEMGSHGVGLVESTSTAAPAIPEFRASARTGSTINGPRATFIRNALHSILGVDQSPSVGEQRRVQTYDIGFTQQLISVALSKNLANWELRLLPRRMR
jgi:hypothetical protein